MLPSQFPRSFMIHSSFTLVYWPFMVYMWQFEVSVSTGTLILSLSRLSGSSALSNLLEPIIPLGLVVKIFFPFRSDHHSFFFFYRLQALSVSSVSDLRLNIHLFIAKICLLAVRCKSLYCCVMIIANQFFCFLSTGGQHQCPDLGWYLGLVLCPVRDIWVFQLHSEGSEFFSSLGCISLVTFPTVPNRGPRVAKPS